MYNEVFITKLKYEFLHLCENYEIALALDIPCQGVYIFRMSEFEDYTLSTKLFWSHIHTYMVIMINLVKIKLVVMMCMM